MSRGEGREDGRPDEDLVVAAQADPAGPTGRAAASTLLGRYAGPVYGLCRRYVRNHERALDLSQDVLLSAFEALSQFERRAPFAGWIFAIARNRCLRDLRPVSWRLDNDADLEDVADPGPNPEVMLRRVQDEEVVLQLVDECLDAVERQALFLRCSELLPVDEITKLLAIESSSGARGVLQSARRKLRAAVQKRGIEMGG